MVVVDKEEMEGFSESLEEMMEGVIVLVVIVLFEIWEVG